MLVHKVKVTVIYQKIIVIALSLFLFSRWSWGAFFPSVFFGGLLAMAALISLVIIAKNHSSKSIDLIAVLLLLMILIMVFNSNHELRSAFESQFFGGYFPIICTFPIFLAFQNKIEWVNIFHKCCAIFGLLFAIVTLICLLNNNLYYSYLLPILQRYYSSVFVYMHPRPDSGFVADYGTNATYIAYALLACVSVLVGRSQSHKKNRKIFLYITVMVLFAILIINGKRSTLLGVVVSFLLCYIVLNKERGRLNKAIVTLTFIVIFILILSFFVPELDLLFRVTTRINDSTDVSNGRLIMWSNAWSEFLKNPLFGKGWRWFQYKSIYKNDVHNSWLQLLSECGVAGALPFYAFFILNIRRIFIVLKKMIRTHIDSNVLTMAVFSFVNQIFFLVVIFFSTAFYSNNTLIIYLLSCAASNYYFRYIIKAKRRDV